MASDRQTLLAEANASVKRNLMSVGGCADTPVDVDTSGNADGKSHRFPSACGKFHRQVIPMESFIGFIDVLKTLIDSIQTWSTEVRIGVAAGKKKRPSQALPKKLAKKLD